MTDTTTTDGFAPAYALNATWQEETDADKRLAQWMAQAGCKVGPHGGKLRNGEPIHPNRDAKGAEECWDNEGRRKGAFRCLRCAGTGRFITGSMNGIPTGPGGKCFRCNGKGYHTMADRRRNYGADMHRKVY